MTNLNTIAYKSDFIKKLQVKETVLMIAAAILIQFVVHLIPSYNNTPMGVILLPMFYIPLIAVIFFKLHAAILTAIAGPALNYLITGNPQIEILSLVTLELVLFVLSVSLILKKTSLQKVSAPLSIVSAKIIVFLIFLTLPVFNYLSTDFFVQSFIKSLPGIFILAALNLLLLRLKEKE